MTDPNDKQDSTNQNKGGFGGFAQKYRDRWAGNHPDSKFKNVDHGSPSQSRPNGPAPEAPKAPEGPEAEPAIKP